MSIVFGHLLGGIQYGFIYGIYHIYLLQVQISAIGLQDIFSFSQCLWGRIISNIKLYQDHETGFFKDSLLVELLCYEQKSKNTICFTPSGMGWCRKVVG